MLKSISVIIFVSFIFTSYSCTDRVSVDEKKQAIESGERIIRIVFDLHGDDIGLPEYQAILYRITASIKSENAGEILSSGFGMGNMEIVVKIKGEESRRKIKEIIDVNYSDAKYSITIISPPYLKSKNGADQNI